MLSVFNAVLLEIASKERRAMALAINIATSAAFAQTFRKGMVILQQFRQAVINVTTSKKSISGIEKGVASVGSSGLVYIYSGSEYLDSFEFGMSSNASFLAKG